MSKPFLPNQYSSDPSAAGRKKLADSTRPYRTIMSEFARLFQRAALKADAQEQAEIMAILDETKQKLVQLLDKIDAERSSQS